MNGDLIATEEVLVELEKKEDDCYEWLKAREHMVIPIDERIQPIVSHILARYPLLVGTLKNRNKADPFVIALASSHGCVAVTQENRSNNLDRPKIPDICDALGVPVMNLLQMFRQLGWSI